MQILSGPCTLLPSSHDAMLLTWVYVPCRAPYLMYFVARQHGTGNQVVGVAEAQYPGGPYKPAGCQPLVTQVRRVLMLCGFMLHAVAN